MSCPSSIARSCSTSTSAANRETDGAQLNYLLPIEHYVSMTVGVGDGFGSAPNDINDSNNGNNRNFGGLSYFGRGSTSFDLTPDLSLEPGV